MPAAITVHSPNIHSRKSNENWHTVTAFNLPQIFFLSATLSSLMSALEF